MKKVLMTALSLVCFTLAFTSCSDDDKDGDKGGYGGYPYSDLTPEQQKEKLAEDGNVFLTKVGGLSETKSYQLLGVFSQIVEYYGFPSLPNTPEDIESIIEINDFYGAYEWDSEYMEWSLVDTTGTALTLILPASQASFENGKNDGKIVVTGEASNVTADDIKLPKKLEAKLYVDGVSIGSVVVKADVQSELVNVSNAEVKFVFDSYTLSMTGTNDKKSLKANMSLTKASESLLTANATLSATIASDGLTDPKSANYEMTILNKLTTSGTANVAQIMSDEAAAEKEYKEGSKDLADAIVSTYNKNTNIGLVSTADKTAIAKFEMFTKAGGYYYEPVIGLRFNDDTLVESGVFFGELAGELQDAFLDFLEKFGFVYDDDNNVYPENKQPGIEVAE